MPTTVINKNEARVPFLGDRMTFTKGQDPLGLQNPSERTFTYLLPGLNNSTGYIRNYSFYSWLFSEYSKLIKTSNPSEQKKFLRKAEYLIVLMHINSGISGIPGSRYALREVDGDHEIYNLNKGIYNESGGTLDTYWQYGFGVFGQYYKATLQQIGIVDEPIDDSGNTIGIYRRTAIDDRLKVSGEDLAMAFEENVSQLSRDLFLKCVRSASVSQDQLSELIDGFDLNKIRAGTSEESLLQKLLLDVDEPPLRLSVEEPETMRRQTTRHLLRYIRDNNESVSPEIFTGYAYDMQGSYDEEIDLCLTGWYFYELNEFWAYGCTSVFNGLLDYLFENAGLSWKRVSDLVDESVKEVVRSLIDTGMINDVATTLDLVFKKELRDEDELVNAIDESKGVERMANAFELIWKLHQRNGNEMARLAEYINQRHIGSGYDVSKFYLNFEKKHFHKDLATFIKEFLLYNIIYRHQQVAYSKMGGGLQSTQKFIIEDNNIRYVENFEPSFTGPRLRNLIRFMETLNILEPEHKMTKKGIQLLEELDGGN